MLNRKKAPPLHPIVDIKYPKLVAYTLTNTIPVYELNMGTQEVIKIDWVFEAGRYQEFKPSLARTTAQMLKEGTENYTSVEIAEKLDFYGATLSVIDGFDISTVSFSCLNKYIYYLLPLVHELLTKPNFPQKELENIKNRNAERLKVDAVKNDVIAYRKATELLFGGQHPYGYNSSEQTYRAIDRADLIAFHQKYYDLAHAKILVSGKITTEIRTILADFFGKPFDTKPLILKENLLIEPNNEKKMEIGRENSVQTAIRIARKLFNRQHEDYPAFYMLNTILGGYFGSRLMSNIREEKGLTYGIDSYTDMMRHSGYAAISTEVNKDAKDIVLHEIFIEMKRLQTELVPKAELEMVRSYLMGAFLMNIDGAFSCAELLVSLDFKIVEFERLIAKIKNINAKELQIMAQKYLEPTDWTVVCVG